ncbi:hypothetical protein PUNSTDRAFT_139320 [Punctularia strigosozonata HHB-11173 SS5]|uniref:Replication factor A protein 3 n=1 Tax=Punctularia strigosozonata (strain HHB-11173) TaxID=741275 RepID=R7S0Q9_PUNST|nr:uncharacterized protein PUNSTDRAFT_139319 [Punctularia strigosozonata HHB-11173 SS5]XP_007389079.1 uncharacterized protein PUNSTDRAFT_139320 [Punctularia strigosozonata HHB-11173 SS5]EIN03793.1 hypothetical protein PUNSTDRAFT_139319 [Punctularia strigosozonata HHB-11173 SS5]EIN03794.1 hypothetical protein PUNSTDRAFT_139320 [Punctularia strigosozonata HHB-11173 SS5]
MWRGTAPRINAARFSQYLNRSVRVPGQVLGVHGPDGMIILETVDKQCIEVAAPDDIGLDQAMHVEITGRVVDSVTLECWWFERFESPLDIRVLKLAIDLVHNCLFVGPLWGIKFDLPEHAAAPHMPLLDETIYEDFKSGELVRPFTSLIPLPRLQELRGET